MQPPFPAYDGDDDFVFICYAHADAPDVYAELQWLRSNGTNIWYDEGIRPGAEWTEELANAIVNCAKMIYFVSPKSAQSRHCRDEVQYAVNHDKEIVVVYLTESQLPPGTELLLGSTQALMRWNTERSRFEQRLLQALEPSSAGTAPARSGPTRASTTTGRQPVAAPGRSYYGVLAGFLVVALFAMAALLWRTVGNEQAETPQAASVAVLPLEVEGGFDDDAYFPDSVAEDLLNRLVSIDGLNVISRRASFAYRDETNLTEVAAALQVNNLLSGRIRKANGLLTLSIELIELIDGKPIARRIERYERRPVGDILDIQAEITRQVALALLPDGLSDDSEARVAQHSTQNTEAYEDYLMARDLLRQPLDDATLRRAAALFQSALDLDPEFAWARAGLCSAHTLEYRRERRFQDAERVCEGLEGYAENLFEVRAALGEYLVEAGQPQRALKELHAAVALNPQSADVQISLARAHAARYKETRQDLDRERAEQAYRRAIELEQDYWYARHAYATYLISQNRLDDAADILQQALELDPTTPPC